MDSYSKEGAALPAGNEIFQRKLFQGTSMVAHPPTHAHTHTLTLIRASTVAHVGSAPGQPSPRGRGHTSDGSSFRQSVRNSFFHTGRVIGLQPPGVLQL